MITEAIILAGGLGTRLRSAVPDLPKCMAPVAGRPFLAFVIDYFYRQGIERFIFSVGYKHELIEEYLHKEYQHIDYVCVVEDEPLGTGGAIMKAASVAQTANAVVLNGDTFFKIDLAELSSFHLHHDAECTICLREMKKTDRYGVVDINSNGRIVSFKEKKFYETSVINGGVYAVDVARLLREDLPEKFSFEKDYFEKMYGSKRIFGLIQQGYFIDIGIPEDYEKAQHDFKQF
jgi:D-glycero-alpha-D-manno-heptose 1-phosphate guanylyltransferase